MISTLHIKNIGIISDILVNLNNGLNILTGETGAGKSLIIDSLQIITGGRFSKEMIRKGEEFSFIELSLYIPENKDSIEGNIIVSREIHQNGRNSCKINGRLVTVNELKNFMKNLIDIHGQTDNQSLLEPNMHIKFLDDFIGNEINSLKEEYRSYYNEYNERIKEIRLNFGDDKEKLRKLDLLRYQINEIESASLKMGEDVEVENTRELMRNSEKIQDNLNEVDSEIGETTIDSISNAIRALERIETIDSKYSDTLNTLKSVYYDLQELSRDVRSFKEEMYYDEEEKQKIEERADLIHDLKRKYGNDIEEILRYKEEIKKEVQKIENSEEYVEELKQKQKDTENKMKRIAIKMSEMRLKYSKILSNNINNELIQLEMKNAEFYIKINFNDKEFYNDGQDKVEFLISTNTGEERKSLNKIASGGEMSRIMLAIKNVLADVDKVPVMIFDEIDTGISGVAAKMVGEKLKKISKNHQVICITHQASIAAKGDYNYFISKSVCEGRTTTGIKQLKEEEVITEIARISSGEYSEIALEHARKLRAS
jgi:DNA repair protein RecN (Recombination protein N)